MVSELFALPEGNHKAYAVAVALVAAVTTLPQQLKKSLAWDLGHEMAQRQCFTVATGVQAYFCDPTSPWQRGSNKNTNRLLRQYLPRRLDFRTLTHADFDAIAHELNERPRQTLGLTTPSQAPSRGVADRMNPQAVADHRGSGRPGITESARASGLARTLASRTACASARTRGNRSLTCGFGRPPGARTLNQRIKSPLLYPLS